MRVNTSPGLKDFAQTAPLLADCKVRNCAAALGPNIKADNQSVSDSGARVSRIDRTGVTAEGSSGAARQVAKDAEGV